MESMPRVNAIINHPLYCKYYNRLARREENRVFCRHQMEHLLDVARIAYIRNLEQELGIDKELIYITAILHDIGKYEQYENRIPHEEAGAHIANQILRDLNKTCDDINFSEEEISQILSAIQHHRRQKDAKLPLDKLLYFSDKQSRSCFACPAEPQCDWDRQKKNMQISI